MVFNLLFNKSGRYTAEGAGPVRGVNLGGWLVLEKWITPSLFDGVSSKDEYSLCHDTSGAIFGTIRTHRDTFITERDFKWLSKHGVEAVRLPVGYWVFGDEKPYFGAIEYVDKAFEWAREAGLKILLDFHGAPGSQNGWDHSGRAGDAGWHKSEANIIKSLQVISKLAKRYGDHPQLLGIELLNEPLPENPWPVLERYYTAAYKIIRKECGPGTWVVIHDNFRPRQWFRRMRQPEYTNLYLDTHHYRCFSKKDKQTKVNDLIEKVSDKLPKLLKKLHRRHGLIVGEWSLALNPGSLNGMGDKEKRFALKAYGEAQIEAFEVCDAWFYWTYRTEGGGTWSYRDSVEQGLLPENNL